MKTYVLNLTLNCFLIYWNKPYPLSNWPVYRPILEGFSEYQTAANELDKSRYKFQEK
jgi:hypothetical protein